MRAIVIRVGDKGTEQEGDRDFMQIGINRWTNYIEKARVFTNTGHAKNALRHIYKHGERGWTYYIQRVKIMPIEAGPLEEYVYSEMTYTW